jgi:hypothetical protein
MERVILLKKTNAQRHVKGQALQHVAPALLLFMAGFET